MKKEDILARIQDIESRMSQADFWNDKEHAQALIRELQGLKVTAGGGSKYDTGDAVVTIFSGAGGDDAEDFSRILFEMYEKFAQKNGWRLAMLHTHANDHGGYRNLTFEVVGENAYGTLRHESGVHRLVRLSPFNANKKRHTSFSMVEVVPKFERVEEVALPEDEISIEYARSGGPGGQNVNKRETAVRIVHIPTNLSVHVTSERSQQQNREKALAILAGKLYAHREEEQRKKEAGLAISKSTQIEWGNQIRSYVLHPYKMVKDHRTGLETSNVDAVLDGEIDDFIHAAQERFA